MRLHVSNERFANYGPYAIDVKRKDFHAMSLASKILKFKAQKAVVNWDLSLFCKKVTEFLTTL